MSLQDIEELKGNLSTYKEQLQQVSKVFILLYFRGRLLWLDFVKEETRRRIGGDGFRVSQVKELLVVDPGNVEYQEMAKGLTEVSILWKPWLCGAMLVNLDYAGQLG